MISTVIVAFSMFSAIPMPQTEWTNKSMRYALCAFPLIGAVIGALVCLWRFEKLHDGKNFGKIKLLLS